MHYVSAYVKDYLRIGDRKAALSPRPPSAPKAPFWCAAAAAECMTLGA